MKKTILLFGAGKSATCCIDYLGKISGKKSWNFIVADSNEDLIRQKLKAFPHASALLIDIGEEVHRRKAIATADLVISMLPPALHFIVAQDCLALEKNLLTASYVDEKMKSLANDIKEKGLLFINEIGLDPGIDHMSAMQLIDTIKESGGIITSFKSHCGGLIAPESDDNPWHYKITWNPRNIVLAGKGGSTFLEAGKEIHIAYEDLFTDKDLVDTHDETVGSLAYYGNRDSISYKKLYDLSAADTFIRTTLRHPAFCRGWNAIISLKLTDEIEQYDTDGKTVKAFFEEHIKRFHISDLRLKLYNEETGGAVKVLLEYLDFEHDTTIIDKGICTAVDVLQLVMENKFALAQEDKDMIVMLHEIKYEKNNKEHNVCSSLIVKGKNKLHTAMAQTVGLPLAIAACLVMEDKIKLTGLHIPIVKEIYEPVMKQLAEEGICFSEKEL